MTLKHLLTHTAGFSDIFADIEVRARSPSTEGAHDTALFDPARWDRHQYRLGGQDREAVRERLGDYLQHNLFARSDAQTSFKIPRRGAG